MKEKILEIGKDSIWYFTLAVGNSLIGFLAVPIFTRIFDPSEYGIYSLVSVSIGLLAPLFYLWLVASAVRFYPEYHKKGQIDVLYSTVLHYSPHFMALFLIVIIPVTAFFLPSDQNRLVICLGIAIFAFFALFQTCLGLMRAGQLAWQYALLSLLVQAGRYFVGAGLVIWAKMGVEGILWGWLGALILIVPIELKFLSIGKNFSWKKYSRSLEREFFSFGFVLIFLRLFSSILTAGDRYILQGIKGSAQVGLYTVAYNLVTTGELLMVSFLTMSAVPVVYKTYEKEGEEETIALLSRITRYMLISLVPTAVGLWILNKEIMTVIASPKYLPAGASFLPLVIGIFLSTLSSMPAMSFYVKKKTKVALVPVLSCALLNVGLNFILIPHYGFTGAAWATMISYLVYFIMTITLSSRYMAWDFPWADAVKICLAGGVMAAGLLALRGIPVSGIGGLALMIVLGAIIYLGSFYVVGGVTRNEKEMLLSMLARIPVLGRQLSNYREKRR